MPVQHATATGVDQSAGTMTGLLEQSSGSRTLRAFLDRLGAEAARERPARLQAAGLAGSALPLVVAHAFLHLRRPIMVVAADQQRGEALRDDLEAFLGTDRVLHLPEFESLPYDVRSPHLSVLDARQTALSRLLLGGRAVVVTTARALVTPVPSPEIFRRGVMSLRVGDPIDADDLAEWLGGLAYQRVPLAEEHGDFARRGGILDVYTFGYRNPLRLEFDGDEIASIREYDPATQRSVRRHERVVLVPRREMVLDDRIAARAAERVRRAAGPEAMDADTLATRIEHERYFVDMRRVAGFIDQGWGSVLRYLPKDTVTVRDAPHRLAAAAAEFAGDLDRTFEDRRRHGELASPPAELVLPLDETERDMVAHAGFDVDPVRRSPARVDLDLPVELRAAGRAASRAGDGADRDAGHDDPPGGDAATARGSNRFHFRTVPQEHFGRSIDLLRGFLRGQSAAGNRVVILCDNPGQRDRLRELVSDGAAAEREGGDGLESGSAAEVEVGQLAGGFTWREVRLAVLTDHEIFARFRRRRRHRRFRAGLSLPNLSALKPGDYVVHIDHGVGVYRGTQRLTVGGHETDCLELHYQRGDKLFIPVDQFDLIQKYVMEEGGRAPSLSRIGGTAWAKTKAKARKAIQDMTDELLRMHAVRSERPGFAFSRDNDWQRQLEAAFIFDDTPDQAKATEDIKQDMERPKPMERLICGDVGFGKTELAVRAAFKAVQDGKQVAILVPTTILASQHHATFSERLAGYPVRVEMLSRFRTAAEQRDVVAELKTGEVDIVIGTHRLLQKDVGFRDLGLIVVDEEQRFGVRHKERLKQLREVADVLTLTATPIPRTMHLALLGTRDISLITTPPRDRVPVHTEIVEFDRDLIADALLREADRGGQSFFVHNRVQSIDAMAGFLRRICPQLSFGIAHGQMRERQLEKVIVDFVDRRFEVLVTSMIIESGIDMPTVNTMVVNRADRFGLAQLYQLRGRVGRSDQRAHCYLMVPPHRALTETAEKRLRAIEEYDDLGSGIKVAMKDLEIRGAGNILGAEQHGHMVAVGYDLYCRMLEESIRELKGEAAEGTETRVATELDAYLPDDYVESSEDKIDFYKRLADTREESQIDELLDELTDRYGRPGAAARNIFELRRVKLRAGVRGIADVDVGARRVRLEFAREPSAGMIGAVLERVRRGIEFSHGERFAMSVTGAGDDPLAAALEVLSAVGEAWAAAGEAPARD